MNFSTQLFFSGIRVFHSYTILYLEFLNEFDEASTGLWFFSSKCCLLKLLPVPITVLDEKSDATAHGAHISEAVILFIHYLRGMGIPI